MKTLWLFAVMALLSAGYVGCTKPTPKPITPPLTQKQIDETHANNFLKAAIEFEADGKQKMAADGYNQLIEKFPDSKAAQTARGRLAKLNDGEE